MKKSTIHFFDFENGITAKAVVKEKEPITYIIDRSIEDRNDITHEVFVINEDELYEIYWATRAVFD